MAKKKVVSAYLDVDIINLLDIGGYNKSKVINSSLKRFFKEQGKMI